MSLKLLITAHSPHLQNVLYSLFLRTKWHHYGWYDSISNTIRGHGKNTILEVQRLKFCCWWATQSCLTLCNPMDCSMPDFPVLYCLPVFAQSPVHWVGGAIQPSHPLLSPSPPALNLSQHQGLLQWVGCSNQVTKSLVLQHQSFQWIFRIDFL